MTQVYKKSIRAKFEAELCELMDHYIEEGLSAADMSEVMEYQGRYSHTLQLKARKNESSN